MVTFIPYPSAGPQKLFAWVFYAEPWVQHLLIVTVILTILGLSGYLIFLTLDTLLRFNRLSLKRRFWYFLVSGLPLLLVVSMVLDYSAALEKRNGAYSRAIEKAYGVQLTADQLLSLGVAGNWQHLATGEIAGSPEGVTVEIAEDLSFELIAVKYSRDMLSIRDKATGEALSF